MFNIIFFFSEKYALIKYSNQFDTLPQLINHAISSKFLDS